MKGNKIQKRKMENSISALPKWHWKFIASVLLFRNCSGKHRRWKQLVQVYTVRQRIKTQGRSTQTVYRSPSLAAATKKDPASEQQSSGARSVFSCSLQDCFSSKLTVTGSGMVVVSHAFAHLHPLSHCASWDRCF